MKKFKFIPVVVCVIMLAVALTGCNLFKDDYKTFQVQYTPNLQLLLGEEWHDDLIKGTATKSDDTEEDVTSKMTIDTSEYNKDKLGKYKIYFEFSGIKVNYEVEVVNEITNSALITSRLQQVCKNSFEAKDGVLNFNAHYSNDVTYNEAEGKLNQYLVYKQNGENINIYYKWEESSADLSASSAIYQMWYIGTAESGTITLYSNLGEVDVATDMTIADFDATTYSIAEQIVQVYSELDAYMIVESFFEAKDLIFAGSLTKNAGLYTLQETDIGTIKYQDDKVIYIDGISVTYNEATIPQIPAIVE